MIDYLTYYYSKDKIPFQSLSALPEDEAIDIMQSLYDDTPFGVRFKFPAEYLKSRKETEQWVREAFIAKGGRPESEFPICTVLGASNWLVNAAPDGSSHAEIRIPLSIFAETDVSFTYPDSMVSRWFDLEKPPAYYQADVHGKVFTRTEILAIVKARGMPEENWHTNLPADIAPYIEAQIWNHDVLLEYSKGILSV